MSTRKSVRAHYAQLKAYREPPQYLKRHPYFAAIDEHTDGVEQAEDDTSAVISERELPVGVTALDSDSSGSWSGFSSPKGDLRGDSESLMRSDSDTTMSEVGSMVDVLENSGSDIVWNGENNVIPAWVIFPSIPSRVTEDSNHCEIVPTASLNLSWEDFDRDLNIRGNKDAGPDVTSPGVIHRSPEEGFPSGIILSEDLWSISPVTCPTEVAVSVLHPLTDDILVPMSRSLSTFLKNMEEMGLDFDTGASSSFSGFFGSSSEDSATPREVVRVADDPTISVPVQIEISSGNHQAMPARNTQCEQPRSPIVTRAHGKVDSLPYVQPRVLEYAPRLKDKTGNG
jgi:hypothetical protein